MSTVLPIPLVVAPSLASLAGLITDTYLSRFSVTRLMVKPRYLHVFSILSRLVSKSSPLTPLTSMRV